MDKPYRNGINYGKVYPFPEKKEYLKSAAIRTSTSAQRR